MSTYGTGVYGSAVYGSSFEPGIGETALRAEIDRLFGRDIWFDVTDLLAADYVVTRAGDWASVAGREALRQSIIRRIITNPGEWQTLPDFGIGARQFVKARNTQSARDELTERIKGQVAQDPRVRRVDDVTIVALDNNEPGLKVDVIVTPQGDPVRNSALSVTVEVRS